MDDMNQPGVTDTTAEESAEPGYTICIRVEGGQLSVGIERESAEEAAKEYADFMPADTIKQALTYALEAYKADGQMPSADGGDKDFQAGLGMQPAMSAV